MRPAIHISVSHERNHQESTQFRKEGGKSRRKENAKRKEAMAKGERDIDAWTLFVVFVFSLPSCNIPSTESQNTEY